MASNLSHGLQSLSSRLKNSRLSFFRTRTHRSKNQMRTRRSEREISLPVSCKIFFRNRFKINQRWQILRFNKTFSSKIKWRISCRGMSTCHTVTTKPPRMSYSGDKWSTWFKTSKTNNPDSNNNNQQQSNNNNNWLNCLYSRANSSSLVLLFLEERLQWAATSTLQCSRPSITKWILRHPRWMLARWTSTVGTNSSSNNKIETWRCFRTTNLSSSSYIINNCLAN